LGSRKAVEVAAQEALSEGFSVIIDRTNVDVSQRRRWLDIGDEFAFVEKWCIMMDTPYEECALRLLDRHDHPTLPPYKALSVLERFSSLFETPHASEGFHRMLSLSPLAPRSMSHVPATGGSDASSMPGEVPLYSATEINNILTRIQGDEGDPAKFHPLSFQNISA